MHSYQQVLTNCFLFMLGLVPFAVAAQNLAWIPVILYWAFHLYKSSDRSVAIPTFDRTALIYLLPIAGTVLFIMVAGYVNPNHSNSEVHRYPWGMMPLILWPVMVRGKLDLNRFLATIKSSSVYTTLTVVWALVAISQTIWAWKIQGVWIGPGEPRSYGLYSHPLTFAYVLVLVWPFALGDFLHRMKNPTAIIRFLALTICLYCTHSRTINFTILASLPFVLWWSLDQKKRVIAIALFVITTILILATPNKIRQGIERTFTSERLTQKYPDFRVAFWHAHWEMIKERPVLGHGPELHTEYRTPYYNKLGLEDFERKFEAHNVYIQVAACGGFLALACFLAWLIIIFRKISTAAIDGRWKWWLLYTWALFCICSLMQNSLFDSEVRFTLTMLAAITLSLPMRPAPGARET